jgi:cytochrome c-type biogenesis protein CcmH/NrfG
MDRSFQMKRFSFAAVLMVAAVTFATLPARAQTGDTPQQLQAMIADGQAQTAISKLQTILQAHPTSGVAWYLAAEAQDASGNAAAARIALGNAQRYAPGLPFANANAVAALQAHLNSAGAAPVRGHSGFSPGLVGIIGGRAGDRRHDGGQ